jgi:glyoxylase-like metal-dependent hydrolase (beta-lactamase superfamily II)
MKGAGMSGGSPRTAVEIAHGVYRLSAGRGLLSVNVYLVRSTDSWVLVDTGLTRSAAEIRRAAGSLFGADFPPAAILLTHYHPDHSGSAVELARYWRCPVYLHPDELPMVGGEVATFWRHSFPLDRWLFLPLLRLTGRKRIEALVSRGDLRDFTRVLDEDGTVPGLPGWAAVPTPGHTPGHVAFFRRDDRLLLSGDAVVTRVGPLARLQGRRSGLTRSPWYFTWDRRAARRAVATLTTLEPLVIASGHGEPLSISDLPDRLRALARS